MDFFEVFSIMEAGSDPMENQPQHVRKSRMRDGNWVFDRARKDGPGAEMPKDKGFARTTERPEEIPYTGDHRSKLSKANDPASLLALKIDSVIQKLSGRSYKSPQELAQALAPMVQSDPQQTLAGVQKLYQAAPHLFKNEGGLITVARQGNPNDPDNMSGAAGSRYKNPATSQPVQPQVGNAPSQEELQMIASIKKVSSDIQAQEELHNMENVARLARQMSQLLMGVIQGPSYSRKFKEAAAIRLAEIKTKYLQPMQIGHS